MRPIGAPSRRSEFNPGGSQDLGEMIGVGGTRDQQRPDRWSADWKNAAWRTPSVRSHGCQPNS
jgi:hypothetical protein